MDLADYNGPLLARNFRINVPAGFFGSVWRSVMMSIRKARLPFDLVELDKMPSMIGRQLNPFCDLPVLTCEYSAHAATLSDNWEQFYASKTSSSTRQTDRRKLRRLGEQGEVQFVEIPPHAAASTLSALVEQKRVSYARMGIGDMFSRPGYLGFYQALAANSGLRDVVHFTRVNLGDEPIATGLGLRFNSRYYLIVHSYQEQFSKFSPGMHHIRELLHYAIDQKMQVFDFTIGDEPYKDQWSDILSPLFRYYHSESIRGRMVVAFRVLRHHAVISYKHFRGHTS